jgi:hypothetical protein
MSFEEIYLTALRLLVQTAAALLGLWIMFQAVTHGKDEPWLYAAAIAMMGLPAARSFESFVGLIGKILQTTKDVIAEEQKGVHPAPKKPPEEPPPSEEKKESA